MEVDPIQKSGGAEALLRVAQLARQIEQRDLDLRVVAQAGGGPLASVAADVEQAPGFVTKHQREGGPERAIRVVVIEAEPRLAHELRQLREALVHRRPGAEHLEPLGFAGRYRRAELREAGVVHVAREVHVGAGHRVVLQEHADLGEAIAALHLGHEANAESGLEQDPRAVDRQADGRGGLVEGQAGFGGLDREQ